MGQSINLQQLCMVRGNCLGPRYCAFALCYRSLQKLPCKDPVMCFPHFQSRNELVKDVAGRAGFSFTDNYALRSTCVYVEWIHTSFSSFAARARGSGPPLSFLCPRYPPHAPVWQSPPPSCLSCPPLSPSSFTPAAAAVAALRLFLKAALISPPCFPTCNGTEPLSIALHLLSSSSIHSSTGGQTRAGANRPLVRSFFRVSIRSFPHRSEKVALTRIALPSSMVLHRVTLFASRNSSVPLMILIFCLRGTAEIRPTCNNLTFCQSKAFIE